MYEHLTLGTILDFLGNSKILACFNVLIYFHVVNELAPYLLRNFLVSNFLLSKFLPSFQCKSIWQVQYGNRRVQKGMCQERCLGKIRV